MKVVLENVNEIRIFNIYCYLNISQKFAGTKYVIMQSL